MKIYKHVFNQWLQKDPCQLHSIIIFLETLLARFGKVQTVLETWPRCVVWLLELTTEFSKLTGQKQQIKKEPTAAHLSSNVAGMSICVRGVGRGVGKRLSSRDHVSLVLYHTDSHRQWNVHRSPHFVAGTTWLSRSAFSALPFPSMVILEAICWN